MSAERPENPYRSPAEVGADDVDGGELRPSPDDLQHVARWQRVLMVSVWVPFFWILLSMFVPALKSAGESARGSQRQHHGRHDANEAIACVAALSSCIAILVGAFATLRIAEKTCGLIGGTICVLLALIPCLGLLALLYVNGLASDHLRAHGVAVGLFGANYRNI